MKKYLIGLMLFITSFYSFSQNYTVLEPQKYYIMGVSSEELSSLIPVGSIITNVKLKIYNLTNMVENENDKLYIYLLDEPGVGWYSFNNKSSTENALGFSPSNVVISRSNRLIKDPNEVYIEDPPFIPIYQDHVPGTEDMIYDLNTINDDSSWTWNIFSRPFVMNFSNNPGYSVTMSSSVLEFIDYAGSGHSFGIGFETIGENNFRINAITLEMTIESYQGTYVKKIVSLYSLNRPPVIL